jgi:hypothetical protein
VTRIRRFFKGQRKEIRKDRIDVTTQNCHLKYVYAYGTEYNIIMLDQQHVGLRVSETPNGDLHALTHGEEAITGNERNID